MDIQWGSEGAHKFTTNVGLITSSGPHGDNIMAAEWTHQVSYSPGLIMVNVGFDKATEENIKASKEFGVSLAAEDQNIVSSVAGGSSGREVDKIAVLKELGVEFYRAKKINAMMVKGASLNMECKLVESIKLGDHMAFVGEVVEMSLSDKKSILYHEGKYYKGPNDARQTDAKGVMQFASGGCEPVQKPSDEMRERIRKLVEKHKK
ncbi:MAG: flavin reductase family protein [Candidatus Aenigmarchaeota archaeon]|nr:flavin reductase family protein [Candidatus Aenigmarchaeota archaeon]